MWLAKLSLGGNDLIIPGYVANLILRVFLAIMQAPHTAGKSYPYYFGFLFKTDRDASLWQNFDSSDDFKYNISSLILWAASRARGYYFFSSFFKGGFFWIFSFSVRYFSWILLPFPHLAKVSLTYTRDQPWTASFFTNFRNNSKWILMWQSWAWRKLFNEKVLK